MLMKLHASAPGQPLFQEWLVALVAGLVSRMPVEMLVKLGIAGVLHPRTAGWSKPRAAIEEHRRRNARPHEPQGARARPCREPTDERQAQEGRLLPRLRAGGHRHTPMTARPRGRQGAGAGTGGAEELELLRRDGGEEHRSQGADLSFGAQSGHRRRDGLRHGDGALQRLLSQPQEGRIRSAKTTQARAKRTSSFRRRQATPPMSRARSRPSTRSTGSRMRSARTA